MARLPRLVLPGYPHHVIQRGNNRQAIFVEDQDRERFLTFLGAAARENDVAVHAYVLMTNHVHLMVTPTTAPALQATLQAVGRKYVGWFNAKHQRTGTLFEGRYKSSVVETDHYALACMRYIELNPVRAGLVTSAELFRWSSHRHHLGLDKSTLITEHPLYWSLGNTPFDRQAAYRAMFDAAPAAGETESFRKAIQGGWAVGTAAWRALLTENAPRRASQTPRGRPLKRHVPVPN